jgi:hypothetical protein
MDKIQKILIKAGREDLAQKYYNKISQFSRITHTIIFRTLSDANKFASEIEKKYKGLIVDEPETFSPGPGGQPYTPSPALVQLFAGNLEKQEDLKEVLTIAKKFGGNVHKGDIAKT